jgi:hypothetical protein
LYYFKPKIMLAQQTVDWLLQGDVSIQYQTHRDLLNTENPNLRQRIENEGWGKQFLEKRKSNGHWGLSFYQPKWISTHYTLLDFKYLQIEPNNAAIQETIKLIFLKEKGEDGGINPAGSVKYSDLCINGMAINYASYFGLAEMELETVVDFILSGQMTDGGFNCQWNRHGAKHSSLHTSISVVEGIDEYKRNGYRYRLDELLHAEQATREFMLMHKLFRSDKTGEIIKPSFLRLHYPCRWYYDILRALEYFAQAAAPYDRRMEEALAILVSKRNKEGQWKVAAHHPGQTHFVMEKAGQPSRWNTLRTLRVLKHFDVIV